MANRNERKDEYANLDAMIQKLGKEQVHELAERGLADFTYRKTRSMRQQAYAELIKKDKRYKEIEDQAKKIVDAKLRNGKA